MTDSIMPRTRPGERLGAGWGRSIEERLLPPATASGGIGLHHSSGGLALDAHGLPGPETGAEVFVVVSAARSSHPGSYDGRILAGDLIDDSPVADAPTLANPGFDDCIILTADAAAGALLPDGFYSGRVAGIDTGTQKPVIVVDAARGGVRFAAVVGLFNADGSSWAETSYGTGTSPWKWPAYCSANPCSPTGGDVDETTTVYLELSDDVDNDLLGWPFLSEGDAIAWLPDGVSTIGTQKIDGFMTALGGAASGGGERVPTLREPDDKTAHWLMGWDPSADTGKKAKWLPGVPATGDGGTYTADEVWIHLNGTEFDHKGAAFARSAMATCYPILGLGVDKCGHVVFFVDEEGVHMPGPSGWGTTS